MFFHKQIQGNNCCPFVFYKVMMFFVYSFHDMRYQNTAENM